MRSHWNRIVAAGLISFSAAGLHADDPFAGPLPPLQAPTRPPQRTLFGLPTAPGFFGTWSFGGGSRYQARRPAPQPVRPTGQSRNSAPNCESGACPLIRPAASQPAALNERANRSPVKLSPQQPATRQFPADPFRGAARGRTFEEEWETIPVKAPNVTAPPQNLRSRILPPSRNSWNVPLHTLRHEYRPEIPQYVETLND